MNPRILLVEGKTKSTSCSPLLEKRAFAFDCVTTRRDALTQLQSDLPDLLIVDGRTLRFDPFRFCEMLRGKEITVPLLLILPEGQTFKDDNLTLVLQGNVTIRRLTNRIKRLLSRSESGDVLRQGNIVLDLHQRTVTRGRMRQRLTPRQSQLLEVFMRNPNRVLTRTFLMKEVWKTDFVDDTRTLEVHIHWLRKAIEEDPAHPTCLTTVRRIGYRFDAPEVP